MASKGSARATQRINITLPRETVRLLDRVTTKGNRSRFIDGAIRRVVSAHSRAELRRLLEEDGRVNRDRDLGLLAEWAVADREAWRDSRTE